jgi:hypothetical protein
MNRCTRCLREISESESICDRCAHEASDPVDGQPTLQRVLENGQPAEAKVAGAAQAAATSKRLAVVAAVAAIAFGGTVTFALLSGSGPAPRAPEPAPSAGPAAPTAAPSTTPAAPDVVAAPAWKANPEWVGFRKRAVAFELPAVDRVQVWLRKAHPYLVVRCVDKQLAAFLYMESQAQIEPQDEKHTVRLRIDDGPEATERWQDSDEHDALFAPDSAAFVEQLSSARVVRIGYRPHNSPAVVAEFHVAGLGDLLAPAATLCGMKK